MPSTSVYFVMPSSRARFAASLMFCGVSKSGSPADTETMSRPCALSCLAFVETAMVADGWMRLRLSAMKPMMQAPYDRNWNYDFAAAKYAARTLIAMLSRGKAPFCRSLITVDCRDATAQQIAREFSRNSN
jgi:hypothetical protein